MAKVSEWDKNKTQHSKNGEKHCYFIDFNILISHILMLNNEYVFSERKR